VCLRTGVVSAVALLIAAHAVDVAVAGPTLGPTYPIAEPDTLDEIKRSAASRDWQRWMRKSPTDYGAFQSATLPHAKRNAVRLFDPTYVLPNDIADENGKVIAAKGTRINVYTKLTMRGRMIVIGNTDAHFRWLTDVAKPTSDDKVLLANGNVLTARRNRQVLVYLLDDRFIERFGLKAVPSIVSQDGLKLRVEEYAVAP
jgi:conjugal transfer pilus assembly protein TraW